MAKLKIGIVGLGYWGPKLADLFQSLEETEVAGICDQKQELLDAVLSRRPQVFATREFSELLKNPQMEAVVIATPPPTHYVLAKEALEKNKHVFVEKPLTTKTDDAENLVRLAKNKNLVLFADHTFCHDEVFPALREFIRKGELGEIKTSKFEWLGARPKPQGPSVLWDSGPHAIASALYLLEKEPKIISMKILNTLPSRVPSSMEGKIGFADGSAAFVVLAWKDEILEGELVGKSAGVTISGSRREVKYEGSFGTRRAVLRENGQEKEFPGLAYKDEPLKTACRNFAKAVKEGIHPVSDGEFGLKVVKVLEAAQISAESRGAEIFLN